MSYERRTLIKGVDRTALYLKLFCRESETQTVTCSCLSNSITKKKKLAPQIVSARYNENPKIVRAGAELIWNLKNAPSKSTHLRTTGEHYKLYQLTHRNQRNGNCVIRSPGSRFIKASDILTRARKVENEFSLPSRGTYTDNSIL